MNQRKIVILILFIQLISYGLGCSHSDTHQGLGLRQMTEMSEAKEDNRLKSKISQQEKKKYGEMLKFIQSMAGSLSFIPASFEPEDKDYRTDMNTFIIIFAIMASVPLVFVIFYIIMRFGCNKCSGPSKAFMVTTIYRYTTYTFLILGAAGFFSIFITILVFSDKTNNAITNTFGMNTLYYSKLEQTSAEIKKFGESVIAKYPGDDSKMDKANLDNLISKLNQYETESILNNKTFLNSESLRNIMTIVIFCAYGAAFILVLLSYWFRWNWICCIVAFMIFFSIPAMVVFEGYNASFYFYYGNICDATYRAMYENMNPIYGRGLGYFINCLDKQSKKSLYAFNYQINNLPITIPNDLKNQRESLIDEHINPIMRCSNVLEMIPTLEKDFCVKGIEWYDTMLTLYTWLFVFILILGVGVDRLEVHVWKKNAEIKTLMENAEVIY